MTKNLAEISIKTNAKIVRVENDNTSLKKRLIEYGFVPGTTIKILRFSPDKNTILLLIRGYVLCMDKVTARGVIVCE